uniref:Uncharacterized protein n=1 Tax=Cucumis melo TaxID=3656 RepID=A0A9I9ECB8_CUCME
MERSRQNTQMGHLFLFLLETKKSKKKAGRGKQLSMVLNDEQYQ